MPAISEENKMLTLAVYINFSLAKANSFIKSDIVNPIPAKKAIPYI